MEVELKKYLELGPKMNFSYFPYIPFCIFITWYKNPEIRDSFSWIKLDTSLDEYKKKYNEILYKIH